MQRTWLPLVTLLMLGLLLSACGATPSATSTTSSLPQSTQAAPAAGVTVTDALGRTVQFPALPQHIVVAGKSTLTIIDAMYLFPEAKERVIALSVGKQPIGDFLSLVDPTFAQKTILDVEAGPEQIAPLQPDAVVMRSFLAEKLGTTLEQLNIPVVYVDLETPEQYSRDVATLGQLFGNPARADEIRSFYQTRLDSIQQAIQGVSEGDRPRVLLLQYSEQGGEVALNVPPAAWLQTTEVELAGGAPVWKDAAQAGGWTVVNFEQIAAWDPDQIFLISYQSDPAAVVAQLKADAKWQALKAVHGGKIYGFPTDIFSWDQPDPRWILGTTWLAGKIQPDLFPDLDMTQQASQFFVQMYGMDPAAVEAQILPKLKGNVK
jgi:iron complex transport system substrate-binding protein